MTIEGKYLSKETIEQLVKICDGCDDESHTITATSEKGIQVISVKGRLIFKLGEKPKKEVEQRGGISDVN